MTKWTVADDMVRDFGMENELTIEFFKAMEEGATTEELYNIYIESAWIETQDMSREEEEEDYGEFVPFL